MPSDEHSSESGKARRHAVGNRSKTGVFVAEDFRSNLIIDRYDVEFLDTVESSPGLAA